MSKEWVDRQSASPQARRRYEAERLVLWATDKLYEAMEAADMTKADVARALEMSRANVTMLLSGERNMTLRTLADLAYVLGQRVEITLEPLREGHFVSAPVCLVRPIRPRVVSTMGSESASTGGEMDPVTLDEPLAA